jgi:hypothetical protein
MKASKVCFSKIRHSNLVTKLVDYEVRKKAYIKKKYDCLNGFPTIDLLELLPDLEETIIPYSFLDGAASPIDMAILKGLARKIKNCTYLEIGSLRGESLVNVADVSQQCFSISLSPTEMETLGYSRDLILSHQFFSKNIPNIFHIGHNSQTFDFSSLKTKFDLVFIDGDHYDVSVRNDTINAFQVLRDENSIIVWHDYGFTPGKIRWSVLAGILDGTPEAKRNKIFHISNSQCAVYINRNFQSLSQSQPEIPDKSFSLKISLLKNTLPHA